MPIRNLEEAFLQVLSNVRAREERSLEAWQEMSRYAEHEGVKKMFETRAFLTRESISNVDECFRLLGKQPVQPSYRGFEETFLEDAQKEIREIQSPALKTLYALHKGQELMQMQTATTQA